MQRPPMYWVQAYPHQMVYPNGAPPPYDGRAPAPGTPVTVPPPTYTVPPPLPGIPDMQQQMMMNPNAQMMQPNQPPQQLMSQRSIPPMNQNRNFVMHPSGRQMVQQPVFSMPMVMPHNQGGIPPPNAVGGNVPGQFSRQGTRRNSSNVYSRTRSESKLSNAQSSQSGNNSPDQPQPPPTAPPQQTAYMMQPPEEAMFQFNPQQQYVFLDHNAQRMQQPYDPQMHEQDPNLFFAMQHMGYPPPMQQHQQRPMHPQQQYNYQPRQPKPLNVTNPSSARNSRNATPATTQSNTGSKRTSPVEIRKDPTAVDPVVDYTPPGTPQSLNPLTNEQAAQLCSTLDDDKYVEKEQIEPAVIAEMDRMNLNDVPEDPNKTDSRVKTPTEYVNARFQQDASSNWKDYRQLAQIKEENSPQHQRHLQQQHSYQQQQQHYQPNQHQQNQQHQHSQQHQYQHHNNPPSHHQQQQRPKPSDRRSPNKQFTQGGYQHHQQQQQPVPEWRHKRPVDYVQECIYCSRILKKPHNEYANHVISVGNVIKCPELKKISCETCSATGDTAHLTFFCPKRERKDDLARTAQMIRNCVRERDEAAKAGPPNNYPPQQHPPHHQQHQQQQNYSNQPYSRTNSSNSLSRKSSDGRYGGGGGGNMGPRNANNRMSFGQGGGRRDDRPSYKGSNSGGYNGGGGSGRRP